MGLVMKFPVKSLIEVLKTNRQQHEKIATQAKADYAAALLAELKTKIELLEAGKHLENPHSDLKVPFDSLDSYDVAIGMLEFTSDESISLAQGEYDQYVNDKWSWKKSFTDTASSYNRVR